MFIFAFPLPLFTFFSVGRSLPPSSGPPRGRTGGPPMKTRGGSGPRGRRLSGARGQRRDPPAGPRRLLLFLTSLIFP